MSPRHIPTPRTEIDVVDLDDRPTLEILVPDLDTLLDAFTVADEAGFVDLEDAASEEGGAS